MCVWLNIVVVENVMNLEMKHESVQTIGARWETMGRAAQPRQASVSNVPGRELTGYGSGCQGEHENANSG
jgi:hypothetical protein